MASGQAPVFLCLLQPVCHTAVESSWTAGFGIPLPAPLGELPALTHSTPDPILQSAFVEERLPCLLSA